VVVAVKDIVKTTYFRIIIALMSLASSAFVIEAGHRWH
jgi:hypothetical protein